DGIRIAILECPVVRKAHRKLGQENLMALCGLSFYTLFWASDDVSFYTICCASDEGFSTWMAFRGNTRDLGSFGEETDEITDLHQIVEEILLTEHGDGVAGIKQHRRDPSGDGVRRVIDGVRT
ncbi:hypothetical protein Tco_0902794, partial [Tanacetum coccineum]